MDRDEANARAKALNDEAVSDGHWLVRETPHGWQVVKLSGGGIQPRRPTGSHTESRPRPESPADPRPSLVRNVPPYGA